MPGCTVICKHSAAAVAVAAGAAVHAEALEQVSLQLMPFEQR